MIIPTLLLGLSKSAMIDLKTGSPKTMNLVSSSEIGWRQTGHVPVVAMIYNINQFTRIVEIHHVVLEGNIDSNSIEPN